jgi:hypothetical protein
MSLKIYFCFLTLLLASAAGHAQQSEAAVPFRIRAALHDPVHPVADLFYTDKTGNITKLELLSQDLTSPIMTQLTNGSLVLYDKVAVDPKNPEASLAASCKVPPGAKQGAVVILPSQLGTKPAYRMVFIDDSTKVFPKGESRLLTLTSMETAVEAGEHKVSIHPGEIARLPPVRKVNEYNMAQTNFYYKQGETWTVFTERQLQYIDDYRRIFIVYVTPGANQPTVSTIVDTATP